MATTTLKILREINDYGQQEIADVLGINQNTYSRLERNPKKLTAEQAKKLAEFYNVSVTELLSETIPTIVFNDAQIAGNANGYVNNVENDNRQTSNTEIASLKEEISYLRQLNSDLVKAFAEKK